jgi:hypothetical protein
MADFLLYGEIENLPGKTTAGFAEFVLRVRAAPHGIDHTSPQKYAN